MQPAPDPVPHARGGSPGVCSDAGYKAEPLTYMYEVRILLRKGLASGRFHAAAATVAAAAATRNPQGTSLQTPTVLFASWLTCGVRMLVLISKPMCFRVSCQPI